MSEATLSSPPPVLKDIVLRSINTIRTLSMDGVQAANSGRPGTPMALGQWLTAYGSSSFGSIRRIPELRPSHSYLCPGHAHALRLAGQHPRAAECA
jgi:hypothetical protein